MKKKITILSVPLFFIIPWIGYLFSLIKIRSKSSAFVYIAFSTLFGYAISFSNTSADSYRYAIAFMQFDKNISFTDIAQSYLAGEIRDIYRILLFKLTSIFSENPKVVYSVAGLIYGIFSYLNLCIFATERGNNTDRYTLILALVFITLCSLSNINGFRFWTGAMLAFCSIYNIIILKKNAWTIGIISTALIHYSFILFIPAVLLINLIVRTNIKERPNPIFFHIFTVIFIASWFLNKNLIDLSFITNTNLLPSAAGSRLSYVNSDTVTEIVETRAGNSIFITLSDSFDIAIKIYVFLVVAYINKILKNLPVISTHTNTLYLFILLFYSFSFIVTTFPSGGRFMMLAHMFLIILIARFYSFHRSKKMRMLILLSLLPFAFKIVFINIALPIFILTPSFWFQGLPGVLLERFVLTN